MCVSVCADVLLVAHPRKVPSALLVSAVVGGDDTGGEESDPKVRLPPDAAAWEHAAVRAVKERLKAPEWVVDWVVSGKSAREGWGSRVPSIFEHTYSNTF